MEKFKPLGSPSTTQSRIKYSGSDATPSPLRMLVATTTRSASTSPSVWTKPRLHGSIREVLDRQVGLAEGTVHQQLRGRCGPLGYSHGSGNDKVGTGRDPSQVHATLFRQARHRS
jgi:hypothetical protein